MQVLAAEIESVRGKDVLFKSGELHTFDSIVFCTGFKRSTTKWLKVSNSSNITHHCVFVMSFCKKKMDLLTQNTLKNLIIIKKNAGR